MWKFKGGASLPNIPARDIPDEEVKEKKLDTKLMKSSGLYKHEPDSKHKKEKE